MADLAQIPDRVVVIDPVFPGMTRQQTRRLKPNRMTAKMRRWMNWVLGWSPVYKGATYWKAEGLEDEELVRAILACPAIRTPHQSYAPPWMPFGAMAADLSVTAANVQSVQPSVVQQKTSNLAITAGMSVVADSSGNYGPGNAAGTAAQSGTLGLGVAVTTAPGVGQPVLVWQSGTVNLGATLASGQIYVVSKNGAGNISPFGDLNTGRYTSIIGVALTTANCAAPGGCYASGATQ